MMVLEVLAGYFVINTVAYFPRGKEVWITANRKLKLLAENFELSKKERLVAFTILRIKLIKSIALGYLIYNPLYVAGFVNGFIRGYIDKKKGKDKKI